MKNFLLNLNPSNNDLFFIFNTLIILITFFLLIVLIINKKKIKKINLIKVRYLFGILLLVNWIVRRGSFLYYGVYNYKYHLDIGFCNLTSILMIIYCFMGNKKLFSLIYYLSFCCLPLAILFPSINYSFAQYGFYSFIINHHINFLIIILLAIGNDLKYKRKEFKYCFSLVLAIFMSVIFINSVLGTSYNSLFSLLNPNFLNLKFLISVVEDFAVSNLFLLIVGIIMIHIGKIFIIKINDKDV